MTNRTDAVNRFDSRTELSSQNRFDSRDTSAQYSNRFDNAMRDDFANRFDNDGALPEGCQPACGILEVLQEGFGFLRSANFLTGQQDVYVAPSQIRRFGLRTGDMVDGFQKANPDDNKYDALIRINTINGVNPELCSHRPNFEKLTPVFPNSRLSMEVEGGSTALRIVDLISPIGKGQRGLIVSPPKAGKTTVLKKICQSIAANNPEVHLFCLLVDERPEEVTDMERSIKGDVVASTFDMPADIENGGSLTIIASALVDTGSKMDEVIFEEFKGTGNMELKLDRDLADRRIFPAIDPVSSGTRNEDLLIPAEYQPFVWGIRRVLANMNNTERAANALVKGLKGTNDNREFLIKSAKKAQQTDYIS